jgi:hypothetical protein
MYYRLPPEYLADYSNREFQTFTTRERYEAITEAKRKSLVLNEAYLT